MKKSYLAMIGAIGIGLTVPAGAQQPGQPAATTNLSPAPMATPTPTPTPGPTPCSYSLGSTSATFTQDGATGTIAVLTTAGCGWTASARDGFIQITSGASSSGPGTVTYTVAEYKGNGDRTGTISVAGQTFTVTQRGK